MLHEGTQRRRGSQLRNTAWRAARTSCRRRRRKGSSTQASNTAESESTHDRDQARRTQALRFEAERHDAATPERARDAEETIDRVQSTATRSAETVVEGRLQSRQRVHGSPCVVRRPATVILQRCGGAIARHGASRDSSARTSATDRASTPSRPRQLPDIRGVTWMRLSNGSATGTGESVW